MKPNRTLVVHVSSSVIGDGEIAPPTRGQVWAGPLRFVERGPDDPDVVRIRARLEPSDTPPIRQHTEGAESPPRWEWSGLLRGDGWTASWRGFVPRAGEVELTGQFWGTFGYDTDGRVRGRVMRVQMATDRYRRTADSGWRPVPGPSRLREVDAAPQFFDDRLVPTGEEDVAHREGSVRVELDLDDVPPLPVRPSVVPGDVSCAGGAMWVADTALPIVMRVSEGIVTRFLLPGAVGVERRVHATPSGCWVTGADGTIWVAAGAAPVRVDDRDVPAGDVVGDTLLACTGSSTWTLFRPGVDPIDVETAAGRVTSVVKHGDSVYAVVVQGAKASARVVRVSDAGESTVGPAVPLLPRGHGEPFLLGDPLRLVRGVDVGWVQEDLSVRDDGEWGGRPLVGGQAGPVSWTVGHVPDGSSRTGWWPLPRPVDADRSVLSWLLTLHDSSTLEPLTSVTIPTSVPRVVFDGTGVLVVGNGLKRVRIDAPLMDSGEDVDAALLWDEADGPLL